MKLIIRLGVTIAILLVLFWKISFSQVVNILKAVDTNNVMFSVPFIVFLYALRTLKWQMLLRYVGIKTNFWYNYKNVLIGTFYSLATPGRAGELARALKFDKKSAVFATVVWEKITDAFFVVALCLLSLAFFFQNWLLLAFTSIAAFAVLFASLILIHGKTITFVAKFFTIPAASSDDYLLHVKRLAGNLRLNAKMLIPTVMYYADALVIAYFLLKALNPAISPMLVFSFPIIILLGNFPISFSGIGVREMVTSITFHAANADPAYGASYGFLLFFIITVIPGLIGGMVHYFEA